MKINNKCACEKKMAMKMSGKILKKEPVKYKFAMNFSKKINQDNEINTRKNIQYFSLNLL